MPALKLSYIFSILSILIVAFKLLFILFTVDKGFDFTDEGHVMCLVKQHRTSLEIFHGFHVIIGNLFHWMDLSLRNMRLLNVLAELCSTSILTAAAVSTLRYLGFIRHGYEVFLVVCLSFCGLFASTIYPSISYYQLTNFNLYISTACLLFLLQAKNQTTPRLFLLFFLIGIFCGFQLFIKFTVSFYIALMTVLTLAFIIRSSFWKFIGSVLMFTLAVGTACVIVWNWYGGWNVWLSSFLKGYELLKLITYGNGEIVREVYWNTDFVIKLKVLLIPVLLLLFLLKINFAKKWITSGAGFFIMLLVCAVIIFSSPYIFTLKSNYYDLSGFEYRLLDFGLLLFVSLLMLIMRHLKFSDFNEQKSIPLFSLFMLPLPVAAYLGSDTPFSDMAYESIFPWYLMIGILLLYILRSPQLRNIFPVAAAMVLIFSLSSFSFFRYHPYYMSESILQQKYAVKLKEKLQVDKPTQEFVDKTISILQQNGYQEGDEVIAMHNLPGLIYLLGANARGTTFFYGPWEGDKEGKYIKYNCYQLMERNKEPSSKLPYIILSEDVIAEELICLSKSVQDFPSGYTRIDSIYYPAGKSFLHIWIPSVSAGTTKKAY